MTTAMTDNVKLVELIQGCFRLAMSAAVPMDQRRELNALGKRLRGALVNLLTASFDAASPELGEANAALAAADGAVVTAITDLSEVAAAIRDVTEVVGLLDNLIVKAISFA